MKNFKTLLCTALLSLLLINSAVPALAFTEDTDTTMYSMYVNDQRVGIVRFPARALLVYDSIERGLKEGYQEEIFIDTEIRFAEAKNAANITNDMVLAKAIEDAIDVKVNSVSISIDGAKICHVKDLEAAEKVFVDIKAPYIEKIEKQEDTQLEEIAFKEDIDFGEEVVSVKDIISPEEAVGIILHGNQELEEYEVQEGDSLWSIAYNNGVSVSDLQNSNPDLDGDLIRPGDIIKIGQQKKLLTVITKEKVKYSKEIPYETEVKNDSSLEKGKTKVVQQGEKGQKDITAMVTREDGQEISREIVEEKVVKEPVKHIEAKGTKEKPKPKPKKTTSPSGSSSNTSSESSRSGSGSGSAVVAYAMKFKGYRYVFGTSGPNTFDCSGFTKYVYGHFGVNLPHSSKAQRSVGRAVSRSNLQKGDILCFSGHVGIYIGNDQFIHASNKRDGVKISSLSGYSKKLITARRIF
ncbi:MAG TPA: LysM peptidoglycan-binding domain-containing protein [Clostridiales bacterium]|nr:LysM peptidoglycan-binding domain-containing protein [Clostridiales bacterium]